MKRWLKRVGVGVGTLLLVGGIAAGGFAWSQTSAFDASVDKVYDVPVPNLTRSSDPAVLARGEHLAQSIAGCATADCHGTDLGGGKTIDMGPLGKMTGPNISMGGLGAVYSDGELARVIRHGVKKDGRTVRLMPVQDINWFSDADLLALVSFIKSAPAIERVNGENTWKTLGKILDRQDKIEIDVARRIDHARVELAPAPSPTKAYGAFIGRACHGCHGDHFSGGPIPGAPPSIPVPLNITPDATGLAGWSYEDFDKLLTTGVRKNGRPLDPFMPYAAYAKMDDTEKRALWEFLRALPPTKFGGR